MIFLLLYIRRNQNVTIDKLLAATKYRYHFTHLVSKTRTLFATPTVTGIVFTGRTQFGKVFYLPVNYYYHLLSIIIIITIIMNQSCSPFDFALRAERLDIAVLFDVMTNKYGPKFTLRIFPARSVCSFPQYYVTLEYNASAVHQVSSEVPILFRGLHYWTDFNAKFIAVCGKFREYFRATHLAQPGRESCFGCFVFFVDSLLLIHGLRTRG